MKNQIKMSANHIEITVYTTVYTQESVENGDSDHSYLDTRHVFTSLEDAAEHVAWSIYQNGFSARNSGYFTDLYTEMGDYNDMSENNMNITFGKNLNCPEIKDKMECLIHDILVREHRFDDIKAWKELGYNRSSMQLTVNESPSPV